ncbi:F-box associated domain containing protein [Tanacetum coccineum]
MASDSFPTEIIREILLKLPVESLLRWAHVKLGTSGCVSQPDWYDELSNDYKVVVTGIELKMATIIYSLKTGKWKEIGHFPCARPSDDGKLLNGALHWVAGKSTLSDSWKIIESRVVDVWVMKVYGVKDSWTKLASIPSPDWVHISAPFFILAYEKLLLRFRPQLLVYDSKDGSSSMIKNECNDACIVVESLVSPFPPLGLADINDDED